ncbi:prevent-host-death protein [Rhizobium sp. 32-5/1]|uniref:type II toxin-antitoxin system Phd/YefM family antitoxin n=1 Tax=Rhizobium sp. 32-5/1 TaxID=3019602 RepID=UPI00240D2BE4|nr:prevent-host-death protein [Rhizobium sp. 32-5/1]WEZ82913.1 prevent-host-death protein [Rhizobium sp. 32-5/1]
MTQIPIRGAATQLLDLARRVQAGESITVTEDGKPLMQLVPVKKKGGINWEALEAYKRGKGITSFFGEIPADFDAPCPKTFLSRFPFRRTDDVPSSGHAYFHRTFGRSV